MKKTAVLLFAILASVYAPDPPDPHHPDEPHPPGHPHPPDEPHPPDHPHPPDEPHPPDHPHPPDEPHPPDHPDPDPEHHQDCHDPHCEHILNEALHNIGMYLNDDNCHIFRDLNCAGHVIQNDEQICGTDGKTYNTHCLFVKARCEKILNPNNYFDGTLSHLLGIQHYGSCSFSTYPPLTTSVSKIMAAITTVSTLTTATTSFKTVSTLPAATTSFTTASAQTTKDSGHVVLGGVFCQFKNSLNCISNLNMVCATNGKFYPNMCELLKVQCDHPTVTTAPDFSYCTLSP